MIDNVTTVGTGAAIAAGSLLLEGRSTNFQVGSKANRQDLVTEFDRRAEALIVARIREAFPSHSILAEESGETNGDPRYQWVIDPLDGTMNFAHRYPLFSVSIAFKVDGVTEWGAVNVPALGELYTARRGHGAHLGDRVLKVSTVSELADALITTGFPTTKATDPDNNLAEVNAVVPHIADLRRSGSAAFDLTQIACGRIEAFWEFGLSAWDIAAGALLVEEAGGRIGTVRDDAPPKKTGMLASNGLVHDALHALMRGAALR
ncbi:MAG: inositol monophosphatase [Chloroflexi bacterium]|nr:inositol monophosphatase [Chloroflexota bacterium]